MADISRIVQIFRSTHKMGAYLYVDKKEGTTRVPPTLLNSFGKPINVMTLKLSPDRKLANANATDALNAINLQGFYLQMPCTENETPIQQAAEQHKKTEGE